MSFKQILAILSITIMISGCNFTEKDKHPKIPFFHEILNDKNLFTPIYKTNRKPIFLKDGLYLTISSSNVPIENKTPKSDEKSEYNNINEFEIRDLRNKVYLKESFVKDDYLPNIFIDSNSNVYINDIKYLAPTYFHKQKIELVIIQKELNDYSSTTENPHNLSLDSLQNKQLLILQNKYDFIAKKDEKYILQKDRLIMLTNQIVNEYKPKFQYFDEFDTPSIIEYKSHGRLNLTSYEYFYYKYKNIKFKFSQTESGLELPIILKFKEHNVLFQSKYGFYDIK